MVVVPVLFLGINFMLLNMYIDKGDAGKAYFPKAMIIIGLLLCEFTVLLLPLDVANNAGLVGCDSYRSEFCGGLENLSTLWIAVAITLIVFALVVNPFAIFYYEAFDVDKDFNETSCAHQCCSALRWQILAMVVMVPVLVIMYVTLRTIRLPISALEAVANSSTAVYSGYDPRAAFLEVGNEDSGAFQLKELTMEATFVVFLIAFMSFLGWIFFIMYAGIGLVALPMDNMLDYMNRPTLLKPIQYSKQKKVMAERADQLGKLAEQVKADYRKMTNSERKSSRRELKKTLQRLKQNVLILERDWEELRLCEQSNYMNPSCLNSFFPYFQLIFAVIGMVISLVWVLHIILYMLPGAWGGKPITPFLNTYLLSFDSWFPLFGTITLTIFVFYLLLCVMRGNFKFGMRFTILPLHPMIYKKTLANSFLVNVGLIMICTLPVIQFTANAFAAYARSSDINTILNVQVKYLEWCGPVFRNQVFVVVLLAFCVLTAMWLVSFFLSITVA